MDLGVYVLVLVLVLVLVHTSMNYFANVMMAPPFGFLFVGFLFVAHTLSFFVCYLWSFADCQVSVGLNSDISSNYLTIQLFDWSIQPPIACVIPDQSDHLLVICL